MVGIVLRKNVKPDVYTASVFDRMEALAARDATKPGELLDCGDGFVTVATKEVLKDRAAKALANKPAASAKPKKAPARPVVAEPAAEAPAATTRKVGGASAANAVKRITAWSYSRYNDWFACPLKARFKYVDGLKEPGSAAMQRGIEIHGLAEQYALGKLRNLPLELQKFKAEFLDLVKRKPACEGEWAFTDKWESTGWFEKGPNAAWCRVKTDVAYYDAKARTVVVIDYKTGKVNTDHAAQLSLYAIGAFIKYPEAQYVRTLLWYLDHGEETAQKFARSALAHLRAQWDSKVKPMLADVNFSPRPGNACRWCHFKNSNGGPCKF